MEDDASSADAACALAPLDTCTEAVLIGLAGGRYFAGNGADVGHRSGQARHHGDQRLHQFVLRGALANDYGQIALGDLFGRMGDFVHGDDQRIQVVLDGVEFAVVGVGDLRRKVAFADAVHVVGGNVQGTDHRVQRVVDALDDLAVAPWNCSAFPRVASLPSTALFASISDSDIKRTQGLHHLDETLTQKVLFGLSLHFHGDVARGDFLLPARRDLCHIGHGAEGIARERPVHRRVQSMFTSTSPEMPVFRPPSAYRAEGLTDDTGMHQAQTKGRQDPHDDAKQQFGRSGEEALASALTFV